MKRFLFVVGVLLAFGGRCGAQCAIYSCANTGAWGTGYNEAGKPVTMAECETSALKGCNDNGGTDCKLKYKSAKGGWWAVIATRNMAGKLFFDISDGNVSQAAAEADVRKKYKAHGGQNERAKVSSWYVYSSPAAAKAATAKKAKKR